MTTHHVFDYPWASLRFSGQVSFESLALWALVLISLCVRRRQWHPTPVLLPGKSHGQRSLVGCSLWDRKESDTTEPLHFHFHALEKEMATHSSVAAWRILGTGEPGPIHELRKLSLSPSPPINGKRWVSFLCASVASSFLSLHCFHSTVTAYTDLAPL